MYIKKDRNFQGGGYEDQAKFSVTFTSLYHFVAIAIICVVDLHRIIAV